MIITPIDREQEKLVIQATEACLQRARKIFRNNFNAIEVKFDLKGRAAGMYRVQRYRRVIRYNPYLFAKYFDHNMDTTIPHEIAHYVTDMLFGLMHIRPHGKEWQAVMRSLDAKPDVRGHYDLTGIPVRRQRRFRYQCACSEHEITTVRHHRMMCGEITYLCRSCQTELSYFPL